MTTCQIETKESHFLCRVVKNAKRLGWVAAIAAAGTWIVTAQPAGDPLLRGFQNPPDSAKPRVWWHWMNGNITKEGIKADLEWMKRVGIGGFQNFDAGLQHAADRREAAGLHDAGVEGRVQVRRHAGRPAGSRNGHRRVRRDGARAADRGCRPRRR